jgi:hypothetical protein
MPTHCRKKASMMVKQLGLLCLIGFILNSAAALAQEVPVTDCDRYAAEADDPDRAAPGVTDDGLNPAVAVPACEAAVAQYPTSRRVLFQLGRAYLQAGNLNGAWIRFQQAAEQGHALAQTYLGTMYLEGTGIARDYAQAVAWFRKSAELGDPVAQYNLATMYESGRGIPKDDAEAARWYGKAAERGFAMAQSSLGRLYATGRGLAKDDAQAVAWYRKAAEQGDESGQYRLAGMYAAGRSVPKDPAEAIAWYRKAAAKGYLDAAGQLAALEAATTTKPAATNAPPPPTPTGSDGEQATSQLPSFRILLGAAGGVAILALVVIVVRRRKPQQRGVARQQLESLKAVEFDRQGEVDSAEAPSMAADLEAHMAPRTGEADEGTATPAADSQQAEDPAVQAGEVVASAADVVVPAADVKPTPDEAPKPAPDEVAKPVPDEPLEPAPNKAAKAAPDRAEKSAVVAQFIAEAIEPRPEPAPPPMKRCSQCQKEIPPNDYFCCHCGALAIRFSDCQHDIRDNARFCPRCGAILRWSASRASAAAATAPPEAGFG